MTGFIHHARGVFRDAGGYELRKDSWGNRWVIHAPSGRILGAGATLDDANQLVTRLQRTPHAQS